MAVLTWHYKPAYYEDADLAFKIRQAGHKVIYQPLAKIVHYEGLTHGQKREYPVSRVRCQVYQEVNQSKFRQRWRARLTAHPQPSDAPIRIVHAHGGEANSRGQVLVIDHRLPTPDRDAGSLRMLEMVRAIRRRGHHVSFIPDDLIAPSPYQQVLQGMGVEVIHHPYYRSVRSFLKQHGEDFELVIISRCRDRRTAHGHGAAVAPRAKVVFDTVDLHFLREEREAQLKQDPLLHVSAAKRKQQELNLARIADLTLVVSSLEKDILDRERLGLDVRIISTIYPLDVVDIPGSKAAETSSSSAASSTLPTPTPCSTLPGRSSPWSRRGSRSDLPGDWPRPYSGGPSPRGPRHPSPGLRSGGQAFL